MRPFRIIISVLIIISIIYIGQIAYLQLFTERYKLNAANTSVKTLYKIPRRGDIIDRNGITLVSNTSSYHLRFTEVLIPENFDSINFSKLVNITPEEYGLKMKEVKSSKYYSKLNAAVFMTGLTDQDVARIREQNFKYPAFTVEPVPEREYLVNIGGNILGYINEVNERYIKSDSTYYRPGDMAGVTGVEKSYEKVLRGEKGIEYIQKDIRMRDVGAYKEGEFDREMKRGEDLTLTIDYEVQKLAEKLLTNKRGAIVAIEPSSGEILALASGPTIDPTLFSGPDRRKNIAHLQLDSMNKPMFDRALQSTNPPGSTFKLVNGLAAMEMGVIDEKTTFVCRHGFHYGNRVMGCHCGFYFVPIAMDKAIQKSCNNFFAESYVKILNKYGNNSEGYEKAIDEWNDILKSFGLGSYFHNDLPVGSAGLIPDSKYYNKRFGKGQWNPYTIVSNSIGQGDILLTPLQIANFTAIIANRGFYYTPHIVKAIDGKPITDSNFTKPKYTKVDKKYFDIVNLGMEKVILAGTGRRIATRAFSQEGKTGTSQNPQGQDHSIFVLIAPAENPKIAVAVFVENAGFGATYAGPMASLVAEQYLLGSVERSGMESSIENASMQGEYRRQWVAYLKKINKYISPQKQDSIDRAKKAIQDSINQTKINNEEE